MSFQTFIYYLGAVTFSVAATWTLFLAVDKLEGGSGNH